MSKYTETGGKYDLSDAKKKTMTCQNNSSAGDLFTWFDRHIQKIKAEELYSLYKKTIQPGQEPVNQVHFGRHIKKTYANVKRIRTTCDGKRCWTYEGLGYNIQGDEENFCPISTIHSLPSVTRLRFFIIESSKFNCKLGHLHDVRVNGVKVLSELTISTDTLDSKPTVEFQVFGLSYDASSLGFSNFKLISNSVCALLKVVHDIKFCEGYTECYGGSSNTSVVREQIQTSDMTKYVYRSSKCQRMLSRGLQICLICQKQKTYYSSLTWGSSAEKSFQSKPSCSSEEESSSQQSTDQDLQSAVQTSLYSADHGSTSAAHNPQSGDEGSQTDGQDMQNADLLPPHVSETQAKTTETLIYQLFPGLGQESDFKLLIESQVYNRSKDEKRIIKLCLMLWGRSPRAYEDLRASGFLVLPTSRLLRYYKNAVQQKPGIHRDIFIWMKAEADRLNLKEEMREGGLIFDEMSIQEDICIQNDGKICGITDLGEGSKAIQCLKKGKEETSLATHVLQLVFLGDTGFRFPFSHYPTREASAVNLFNIIWQNIGCLRDYGFKVNYISMDGASPNRTLMRLHFGNSTLDERREKMFEISNPMPPNKNIVFLMDPSHCFKKIRNNLLKSGDKGKRRLEVRGTTIEWRVWIAAYHWDRSTNSMRVHQRLTNDHLFPDNAQKMRNHLAEEVLDENMLYLVQSYQRTLTPEAAGKLNVVIEFLTNTAALITVLRDHRSILSSNDSRLEKLLFVHKWFLDWEKEVLEQAELYPKNKVNLKKKLMSDQTREDLSSAILGFVKLCYNKTNRPIPGSVVPALVNTDVVENIFCQQRGLHHGNSTNPNYSSYSSGINAVILGQSSIANKRKSNCGLRAADPIPCQLNRPLKSQKKADLLRI